MSAHWEVGLHRGWASLFSGSWEIEVLWMRRKKEARNMQKGMKGQKRDEERAVEMTCRDGAQRPEATKDEPLGDSKLS